MERIEIILSIVMIVEFFLFLLVDKLYYGKAKYPERCKWYYNIPCGGIWAYLKLGGNL